MKMIFPFSLTVAPEKPVITGNSQAITVSHENTSSSEVNLV